MIIKFIDPDGRIQINEITDFACSACGQKFNAYCEVGAIEVSDAFTKAIIMSDSGAVIEQFSRENKRDDRKPVPWVRYM